MTKPTLNLSDLEAKARAATSGAGLYFFHAAASPDVVLALVARVRELEDALRLVVDGEPEGMAIAEAVLARGGAR